MAAPVPAPDPIAAAVRDLSERSGQEFVVSETVVPGTTLYVVYAAAHPLPAHYAEASGVLGFRVPQNFPDACPEEFVLHTAGDSQIARGGSQPQIGRYSPRIAGRKLFEGNRHRRCSGARLFVASLEQGAMGSSEAHAF